MRINSNKIIGLVAVTLGTTLLGLNGTAVRADVLPSEDSPVVTPGAGTNFLYSYEPILTNTQNLTTGDFFIIYDFNGFVGVTAAPANFVATTSAFDQGIVTSTGTINANETDVTNVRFTYTGASTILGGPLSLGTFTLESTFAPSETFRAWVGGGTDKRTNLQNGNITNVTGPGTTVIPEPGEYAFAAFAGASLLGLVVRARRRNSGVAA